MRDHDGVAMKNLSAVLLVSMQTTSINQMASAMPLSSVFDMEKIHENPANCTKKDDQDDTDSTDKESTTGSDSQQCESMTWLRRRGLDSTYGKTECRQIPIQALYENGGSALYEQIEQLPEYYPYREEKRLLQDHSQDIERFFSDANNEDPTSMVVIELGCGDCTKTSILLSTLQDGRDDRTIEFVGIDCSFEALDQAHSILSVFPRVRYTPICANFLEGLSEAIALFPDRDLCVLFLGATIGNMSLEVTHTTFHDHLLFFSIYVSNLDFNLFFLCLSQASQHLLQEITSTLIATDRSVSFLLGVGNFPSH